MKRIRLAHIYEWGLLAVLFIIVLHAPLSVGFGSLFPEQATLIKAWKEIALGLLAIPAIVLLTRNGMWRNVLGDRVIQLSFAYLLLHLLLVAVFRGDVSAVVSGLLIDLRYVGIFVLMYVLVRIRPTAAKLVAKTVAAGAVVVLGFGLLQVTVLPDDILAGIGYSRDTITPFTTIDSNPEFVRINSTLRGPNPLGAICVVYAALALAYIFRRRSVVSSRRLGMAAASLIGSLVVLSASFSRSAYLATLASLTLVAMMGTKISGRIVLAALSVVIVLGVSLSFVSSTDWYSNVILHEDPESMSVVKSNDGHVDSFMEGANRMAVQPFGAGIGSTGSASLYDDDSSNDIVIENIYFFIAHESGWLGVALFLGIFGIILARLWHGRSSWVVLGVFASGVGLALVGILQPVWVDETVALTWWALAGALLPAVSGIIGDRHDKRTRKQTPARTT